MECSVAHLHINRFKASCVSRDQDLQANSLRLKITTKKISLESVRQISRQKPAKASNTHIQRFIETKVLLIQPKYLLR
jgi:hypothetical protein